MPSLIAILYLLVVAHGCTKLDFEVDQSQSSTRRSSRFDAGKGSGGSEVENEASSPCGAETGRPQPACQAPENPCAQAVCDAELGCTEQPKPNNATCTDEDPCTIGDHCQDGLCIAQPKDCSALDGLCRAGACNSDTGNCEQQGLPDGTPCGSSADSAATCRAGACARDLRCEPLSSCSWECSKPEDLCSMNCMQTTDCTLACGNGAHCDQDCARADRCETACAGGASCAVDCTGTSSCRPTCTDADCDIRCARSSSCGPIRCVGTATCKVECQGSSACGPLVCQDEATCIMDCNGASSCNIACEGGAACEVNRSGTASVIFICEGIERSCNGGIVTCNRPCPDDNDTDNQ